MCVCMYVCMYVCIYVETSVVYLMQMYMFVIEVLQNQNVITQPVFFPLFLVCTTALWPGKENIILTMYRFGQSHSQR